MEFEMPNEITNFDEISFHDSGINKVIEDIDTADITYEIDYPVDWGNNKYEKRQLVFRNTINYEINEIPFGSKKQILDITELEGIKTDNILRRQIKIETNAGYRKLYCTRIEFTK